MTTFADTIETLQRLLNALGSGDSLALERRVKEAETLIQGYRASEVDAEIARFALSDWRIEDDAQARHEVLSDKTAQPGEIVIQRIGSGLMIDGYAPGLDDDGAHGVGIEFDRGSLKLNLYRAGRDDVQAFIHVDSRGAHMCDDGAATPTAVWFRGEDGAVSASTEWEPEEAPGLSPAAP